MIVHLVMQLVDLGGCPVRGYVNADKAMEEASRLNVDIKLQKRRELENSGYYPADDIATWLYSWPTQFYIEEVEVVE